MSLRAEVPSHALWSAVDALVDRAPSDEDIKSHRLEILAARRRRELGRPVPEDFVHAERMAGLAHLTAPLVLDRVREAYAGRIVLLKGPAAAAFYPDPTLRGFGDIDILVDDAEEAHAALRAAGWQEIGDPALYEDIHHLRPLLSGGLPLFVEIHSRPKWLDRRGRPPTNEILDAARPGDIADGVLMLPAEHHAVLLAVHSWAHEPLRRLRDIVDVAAALGVADAQLADELARHWGVRRLWRTTVAAVDSILYGGPDPRPLLLWAQNLGRVRERTVLEMHVERWLSDFSALPAGAALKGVPRTIAEEVSPEGTEGWRAKLSRTALAVRNAPRRRSEHDGQVERLGGRGDSPNG